MGKVQNQPRQKPNVGDDRHRDMPEMEIRAIDQEKRTVELSFSSETPVQRWWGTEILCHDEGCVDLTRLQSMGVLLFIHSQARVLGKVLDCSIDTEAKKGRALVQFDEDDESELIFSKVRSGTLKATSCGYVVDSFEEVAPGKTSSNGRFTGPCEVALRWTPYEISIVPVPADASVGVGRSADFGPDETPAPEGAPVKANTREVEKVGEETKVIDPAVAEQERQAGAEVERKRTTDIMTLCRELKMEADSADYISRGMSVDAVRAAILDKLKERNAPVPGVNVKVGEEAVEKFRSAAPHALLQRAGLSLRAAGIEKAAPGADELTGMSLRSMMEEYLRITGETRASRMSPEELMQRALTPDSQFVSILNQSVNASMLIGHNSAGTTYQEWVRFGSNQDFKATSKFRLSEAPEPQKVLQNGEIKSAEMSDEQVTTKLNTYAEKWGFTRQALVNDDLSVIVDMPRMFAIGCERKKNADVYAVVNVNAALSDGYALFCAEHGNLANPGAAPSVISFGLGRAAMRKQTGIKGEQALNIVPRFVLVGVDVETPTEQLVLSLADPASSNPAVVNAKFVRQLVPISDAEIVNTNSWTFAADPAVADTVEFTTLNGKRTPTIESRVGFDVLGMEWRLFDDWGVTVLDYRAMYHNPGAADE